MLFVGLEPTLMLPDLGFHDRQIGQSIGWPIFYLQYRHHDVGGLPLWDGRGVKDSVFWFAACIGHLVDVACVKQGFGVHS
jgi:hypothetical protein